MKLKYDTTPALKLAQRIASFLRSKAEAESQKLAEIRGSFPNISKSIYKEKEMRNATLFTIAPTGTISRLAGCSSSIEPIFAFEFTSKIIDGEIKSIPKDFFKIFCKVCGTTLPDEKCPTCPNCGWNRCSGT